LRGEFAVQKLTLDLLAAGMVVAKPVANDKGMVLLTEGTELTEALIERLGRMDIPSVTVEGHPVDLPGQPQVSPEQRVAQLDLAFSKVEADPEMRAIKKMFVEFALHPPSADDGEGEGEAVEGDEA
jgi:hypothetical protein